MISQRIRPLAICLFQRGDHILVFEGYDSVKDQTFYRPLGGGIEFGESGAAAAVREIREEIGAEITDVCFIQTLENIFTCEGESGHEIVFIYEARFVDPSFYHRESIEGAEENGAAFRALWRHKDSFSSECPLYPEGLRELLND
jgi:8-oxo-dGTP pyrophosphatase MutT (NUDIX family)